MNNREWINSSVMAETECTHRESCGRQIQVIREAIDEQGRQYTEWGSYCGCCGAQIGSTWREYEDPDLRGIHALGNSPFGTKGELL